MACCLTNHNVLSLNNENRDKKMPSSSAAAVASSVGTLPPTGPNPPFRLWQKRMRSSSIWISKRERGSFLMRRPDRRTKRSEREEPGTITYPNTGWRYSLSLERSFAIFSWENPPDSSIRTILVRSSGRGNGRGRFDSRSRSSFNRPFSFSERERCNPRRRDRTDPRS